MTKCKGEPCQSHALVIETQYCGTAAAALCILCRFVTASLYNARTGGNVQKALFFLSVLNDTDIDWLIAAGSKRDIALGSPIIEEGRLAESLFIVLDGRFSVRTGSGVEIARLKAGEIIGEISFVDRRPPSASVKAIEPSCVLAIPRAELEAKLTNDIHFAVRFYRALALFLSHRLRSTVGLMGYGQTEVQADEHRDELDPDTLDNLSLAGARFDWLQRRLKAI